MNTLQGSDCVPAPRDPNARLSSAKIAGVTTRATSISARLDGARHTGAYARRIAELFTTQRSAIHRRTDCLFAAVMSIEWFAAMAAAIHVLPEAWPLADGGPSPVKAALVATAIAGIAVTCAVLRPGAPATRYVVAIAQILMSALLILVTGGRIETHFHVFGSLAFLAFYRDGKVIAAATGVILLHHAAIGTVWPRAVFGDVDASPWRCAEHAVWIAFEATFLLMAIRQNLQEMRAMAERQVGMERANEELAQEISVRKRAEERLLHDATHDALSGLPNRLCFMGALRDALQQQRARSRGLTALLFIDLDRFKFINDSLGHAAGDRLLVEVALRLHAIVREGDTVARLGGDEFTILLENVRHVSESSDVAARVQAALARPLLLGGNDLSSSASIGIAISVAGKEEPEELLRDADTAMYQAKAGGKARYQFFDLPMHAWVKSQFHLSGDLRRAIDSNQFLLHYQPIVALDTGRLKGFECLLRWRHPTNGLLGPDDFIRVAEESGLMGALGRWVLREACAQLRRWRERYNLQEELMLSVNASGLQLGSGGGLVNDVRQVLEETQIPPGCLKLELTESVLMENARAAVDTLAQLRDMGVQMLIDDFGTGYSSLSYLHRLPIDALKIDRSFIADAAGDRRNVEIVKTVLRLSQGLNLDVVAEGIETEQQARSLRRMGCQFGQGYFFSRGVDAERAAELIVSDNIGTLPWMKALMDTPLLADISGMQPRIA